MQKLGINLIKEARKEKIKKLEKEMREVILANKEGAIFICPFCNYVGEKQNRNGSAKVIGNKFFKCFACGKWRKI